jgi:hypothetical protein
MILGALTTKPRRGAAVRPLPGLIGAVLSGVEWLLQKARGKEGARPGHFAWSSRETVEFVRAEQRDPPLRIRGF